MHVFEVRVETEDCESGDGLWRFYPIGDPHLDVKGCDRERLEKYIALVASDPHAVWVAVGDFVDGRTPSHHWFEPSVIAPDLLQNMDNYVAAALLQVEHIFRPLKGTNGIVLQGNHERQGGGTLYSGFAWEIARRLEVPFGADECLVRVMAATSSKRRGNVVWRVHAHHGAGGGMYKGGKINRFINTVGHLTDADILVRGHVHDSSCQILPYYTTTAKGGARLVEKQRAFLTAPSFLQQRTEGVNTYASRKGYPPSDTGLLYLEVRNPPSSGTHAGKMRRLEAPF